LQLANHKSAAKRARQTERRQLRNSRTKSSVRTTEKKVLKAIEAKKVDEAQSLLREFTSVVSKAAQKGVVHSKKAARRIGRLAQQISALSK